MVVVKRRRVNMLVVVMAMIMLFITKSSLFKIFFLLASVTVLDCLQSWKLFINLHKHPVK